MASRIRPAKTSGGKASGPQPGPGPVRPSRAPALESRLDWSYGAVPVQPKLQIGAKNDPLESGAEQMAQRVTRRSTATSGGIQAGGRSAPRIVQDVLGQSGSPLDGESRHSFEQGFQRDFSAVRIHTGPVARASARAIQADAYTAGDHIVLDDQRFAPSHDTGRELLAHELAHVVQQDGARVHRRVSMRDVGRGEHSGFARLPELVDRLNRVANGLVFLLDANNNLTYQENPYGTMTEFERQMKGFIDSGTVIPLRLTNHEGLVGSRQLGFHNQVSIDEYDSAYVDVDDLLASDDLNFQTALTHLITERAATRDYARRVGTFIDPATGNLQNRPEFERAHARGLDAEAQVLRDFFQDPTIRLADEPNNGPFDRVWRNSRGDLIRERVTSRGGVDALSTSVRLRDGRTMTGEQYRDFLANQRQGANP